MQSAHQRSVVLIRHGESEWNSENRFTGWTDVGLTDRGVAEAREAALRLRRSGYAFDVAHTSVLKRAVKTTWIILEELDLCWIPVHTTWRLNERHYGALQGFNKAEMAREVGAEQVFAWRRSYGVRPPPLAADDPRHPGHDPRYQHLSAGELPATESLADTTARVLPYWREHIVPDIRAGQCVLVVAHANSLRALVKVLDGIPDDEISGLYIPTAIPLVYRFDASMHAVGREYLATREELERAMQRVKALFEREG